MAILQPALKRQRRWYLGFEATPDGSYVLANRPMLGKGKVDKKQPPATPSMDEERNSTVPHYREYRGVVDAQGSFDGPVSYQELPVLSAMMAGPNRVSSHSNTAQSPWPGPTATVASSGASGTFPASAVYFQVVARYANAWAIDAITAPGTETASFTGDASHGVTLTIYLPPIGLGAQPSSYDVYMGTTLGGTKYYLGSVVDSGAVTTTFTAAAPVSSGPVLGHGSLVGVATAVYAGAPFTSSLAYSATGNPATAMPLLVSVSGYGGSFGGTNTIGLAGTDSTGASISESLVFTGPATMQTTNSYATISASGITSGAGWGGTSTLLAAGAITNGVITTLSLTTQPDFFLPQKLTLTVSNNVTPGNITITGLDALGGAVTETLTAFASGVAQTTTNSYAKVNANGIVTTNGFTAGGVTLAVAAPSAQTLLSAAAVTASAANTLSLTKPTGYGVAQYLSLKFGGLTASGTVTLSGLDASGNVVTETMSGFTNNTAKTTANQYAYLNAGGIVTNAAFTTGTSLTLSVATPAPTLKIMPRNGYTYYVYQPESSTDQLSVTVYWGDNTQAWYAPMTTLKTLELKTGVKGKSWMIGATFLHADRVKGAYPSVVPIGGSQTAYPAVALFQVENAQVQNSKLYFGDVTGSDNWGSLTWAAGKVVSFDFKFDTQAAVRQLYDGIPTASGNAYGATLTTCSIVFEWSSTTEYDQWQADTFRRVRLTIPGTGDQMITLDLSGKWITQEWAEQGEVIHSKMEFEPIFDSVIGESWKYAITNDLAMVA